MSGLTDAERALGRYVPALSVTLVYAEYDVERILAERDAKWVELNDRYHTLLGVYCALDDQHSALVTRIEALVARAESGADAWGACPHEWARIADLRALLSADDTEKS